MIEIREKEIAVDKLMIEEKIDWAKVEKVLTETAVSHSKMRLIQMKEQKEISAFLSSLSQKSQTEKAILEQLEMQKKYLLQQMFV